MKDGDWQVGEASAPRITVQGPYFIDNITFLVLILFIIYIIGKGPPLPALVGSGRLKLLWSDRNSLKIEQFKSAYFNQFDRPSIGAWYMSERVDAIQTQC